jgi:inner membrane protein
MDSLTQILLGASVAAVCVPENQRRKAVLVGAVLGTVPDLDVFINYGDAVANFTYHRGFSHSLFVLFPFALVVWAVLKNYYQPVRSAPEPWLLAIMLALITHPLLDAHTTYGTQLFWPLTTPPVMWSTIFIIDPIFTLPLLIAVLVTLIKPDKSWAAKTLAAGIIFSSGYLGWTWVAKHLVEQQTLASLKSSSNALRVFSTPTPFNSLLWRIVVLQEDNYLEGYYSLLHPETVISFQPFTKNKNLLEQVGDLRSVKRLEWFSHGFLKSEIIQDNLVISDLRMGFEETYIFRHAVAETDGAQWREIDSELLRSEISLEDLNFVWQKLIKID